MSNFFLPFNRIILIKSFCNNFICNKYIEIHRCYVTEEEEDDAEGEVEGEVEDEEDDA